MLQRHSPLFSLLLGGLIALPPISIDLGLPAYSATAQALGVPEAAMTLTLSLFMAGFAAGPLVYGPVSERFGRRPVLLAGLALYLASSAACLLASSFAVLLVARLVQGAAASAGTVLAIAAIRDLFPGPAGQRKMSVVTAINGIAPLLAPSIGVALLAAGGWRLTYAVMTIGAATLLGGVGLGFGESIARRNPDALAPSQLWHGYRTVLTHRLSGRAALFNALNFGVLFTYIAGSPIVLIAHMGISQRGYGLVFAATVAAAVGGTTLGMALRRHGLSTSAMIRLGLVGELIANAALLALNLAGCFRLELMLPLMLVSNAGVGMIGPAASFAAMRDLPELAGFASAVLTSLQTLAAALAAALVSALFALAGPAGMACGMTFALLLALAIFAVTPFASEGGK
jgi:DHA1 family bicyclomycin/chloramphenicol resistance-like MFS transporter